MKPLSWLVLDAKTLEPIIYCTTRARARYYARACNGRVARLVLE